MPLASPREEIKNPAVAHPPDLKLSADSLAHFVMNATQGFVDSKAAETTMIHSKRGGVCSFSTLIPHAVHPAKWWPSPKSVYVSYHCQQLVRHMLCAGFF